ncbi:serine hydrolase, partial [Clostridioides difficile]
MSEQLKGFIHTITEQQLNVFSIRILQKGHLLAHWDRDKDQ